MRILGISAFYHDSAAALVEDGAILAAAQEERFTRKKHDAGFPRHAAAYCLEVAGCGMGGVDHVVFYDKPFLKFERLLETYLATAPKGFASFRMAMPVWIKEKLFQKSLLREKLHELAGGEAWNGRLLFTEHHLAHAASAFYPSPFKRAAILTMDGVGEWCTTSLGMGEDTRLEIRKEIHFPHSLGLLYSAFTYYTGFKVNSGEYKVMGLAPYGEPRYAQLILDHLIDVKPDGSFKLDQRYFNYTTGLTMTSPPSTSCSAGRHAHPNHGSPSARWISRRRCRRSPRRWSCGSAARSAARRVRAIYVLRGVWPSTAWPTASSSARASSTSFGSSPPPAMPAVPWERLSPVITSSSSGRGWSSTAIKITCRAPIWAHPSPTRRPCES